MKRFVVAVMAENVWVQLLFFGILTLMSLFLFSAAGQLLVMLLYGGHALGDTLDLLRNGGADGLSAESLPGYTLPILYITQISSQIGLFLLPPFLFIRLYRIANPHSPEWFPKKPTLPAILLTLPLVILSLPLISWLTDLNMSIPLPDPLIRAEEDAGALTQIFFHHQTPGRFLVNLLMIAVIPAIGEEFFFRGVLQQQLRAGLRNPHVAVFITALVFSFFHFQFQGFIPRMFLGLLFGYLMVWSGSVWLPVAAHFINNGSAVVVEYLSQLGVIRYGYQDFGQYAGIGQVAISILLTVLVCMLIRFSGKTDAARRDA
ncbi:MAG TPA: type II CAAX endopeptidase family protein [Bacteroidales bacterium]|nr:type II CAAX endopeptidase family protein [Bacteroidales bacterium]HRZ49213.1 type II CAAX endopeptidase family protein [Bacteroidales bacterium]